MQLSTWIEKEGPKKVAKDFGVDPSTVSFWRKGKSLPRPHHMAQIVKRSKGKVTFANIIEHFLANNK